MEQDLWDKAVDAVHDGRVDEALSLFKSIADDGEKAAYVAIGNLYEVGGKNIKQDYEEAFGWYKKAIEEVEDADGTYCIAKLYFSGRGVEKDYRMAFLLFEGAADSGVFLADYYLGNIYHFGIGLEKDFEKARHHYKKAIEQDHVFSIRNLARLEYESGNYFLWVKYRMLGYLTLFKIFFSGSMSLSDNRLKQV